MKITSVECYLGQFITMKINTDEGIYGWGEALPLISQQAVWHTATALKQHLVSARILPS